MLHTVTKDNSILQLNSHGARIEKLVLNNVDILGTFVREDGKTESTHPCTLQHNYDRDGKNKHGKGRDSEWNIIETPIKLRAQCVLDTVHISQEFIVSHNTCTFITTHKNMGDDVPTNFAEHNYFATPLGNREVTFNNEFIVKHLESERVDSPFDYIMRDLHEKNTIIIPGIKKNIIIELSQPSTLPFKFAAIWVMGKDNKYICIEPVVGDAQKDFIHSDAAILPSGKSQVTEFTLRLL